MASLVWDQLGERYYEAGVSKCVLYGTDTLGVAWSGITAIEENIAHETEAVHFDGFKFNEIVTVGDFTAMLRALTYPDAFLSYEGVLEDQKGFFIANQAPARFSLSYQTKVSNDLGDPGYKIHILYNLTAIPSQRERKTLSLDIEPLEFEWSITSIPEEIETFRPTSHVIFDSRRVDSAMLADIEEILYGGEDNDAYLPSLKGLASFIRKWNRLVIHDNGDGTWTATSPDDDTTTIIMVDDTTFQIDSDTATYLDADTYTITSSDKNEEDVWPP